MINEIYINGELVETESPKKKFKENGYSIKCTNCDGIIERKWFDNKILKEPYKCKSCVMVTENPMHKKEVYDKHNKIVKSKEYSEKLSKACSGELNGFYGKTHTDETIRLIIHGNKEWYNNLSDEDYNELRTKMSEGQKRIMLENPTHYRRIKSKAARQSHKSQFENMEMNGIETTVFNYLKKRNVNVIYSVILASYQFDFGIKDERILIEVDGDYWHGNPKLYNEDGSNGKRKLNEIQRNKKSKDIEKTKWAESRGFKLIRIWESEVNDGTFKEKLNKL